PEETVSAVGPELALSLSAQQLRDALHSTGVSSPDRLQSTADHGRDKGRRHHIRPGIGWAGHWRPPVPRAVGRPLDWMARRNETADAEAAHDACRSAPRPRHRSVVSVATRGDRVLRRVLERRALAPVPLS